jgi:hypothetical protein
VRADCGGADDATHDGAADDANAGDDGDVANGAYDGGADGDDNGPL